MEWTDVFIVQILCTNQTIYVLKTAILNVAERVWMCGIFGFTLRKPVPTIQALGVLERLEVHQYENEPTPIGGYGAGIAILDNDGGLLHWKIGKTGDASPAKQLASIVDADEASVLIGHVRMPSPEFMTSVKFKEAAQPYVVERDPKLIVASVHNGKVQNYKELRAKLGQTHVFESEKFDLIDSEVIPHFFEELLSEKEETDEALYSLLCTLHGSSAIGLLQAGEENAFIHLIHRGKTRGLTVWANGRNEMVFCSRKEALTPQFRNILTRGKFKEKASIAYREDAGLKLSFQIVSR
jgi:glucosamine 6-phosphate synthetase-like amidotransferase/phosphosugar isomerase protein